MQRRQFLDSLLGAAGLLLGNPPSTAERVTFHALMFRCSNLVSPGKTGTAWQSALFSQPHDWHCCGLIFSAFLLELATFCFPYSHTPMPTLTIELLNPKVRTILDGLEDAGLIAVGELSEKRETHSIMELKGLGAELWKDESADEYLRKERESWDF